MDNFFIVGLMIILSAFFSGMEIAYISANKLRIELDKKHKTIPSFIVSFFTKRPSKYITTMLVGNNIALVVYGIVFAKLLDPLTKGFIESEYSNLLVQTLISTIIILIFAEFMPKAIFRLNPNFTLNIFATPVFLFYVIFYPITSFTVWLSKSIMKNILKVKYNEEQENIVFGRFDLDKLVEESKAEKSVEEIDHNVKIFKNALYFSKVRVKECLVPRTEIVALEENSTVDELRDTFVESGVSKVLIFKENIDNIIGYVHSSEIFKKPKTIKTKVSPISIVPESMNASKLLKIFMAENKSIAVVVDEFGGTEGIVTREDILEEIFGEIEDEHDNSDYLERKIDDSNFVFSGRLEIDYINEKYKLDIPEEENYETLAGFILSHHESIPKVNDIIKIENRFKFQILKASNTKIDIIKLEVVEKD